MRLLRWLRPGRRPPPLDLGAQPALHDPFAAYEALRESGPVHYLPKHDFWIALSHAAVKEALERPDLYSNIPYADVDAVLLAADPPRHTAVRKLVGPLFSAETMTRVERVAETEAAARLHREFDAVGGYSLPVSRAAAADLLGFNAATAAAVEAAAEAAQAEPDPVGALIRALDRLAERSALFPDLLDRGSGLVDETEVRSLIRLLWLAATTTTERVISRAILCLLQEPATRAALAGDRSLIGPYLEEVMRLYPPELTVPRRTRGDAVLAATRIPAGAEVRLCVAAANRDPAVYPDPSALRLDRATKQHFAFGGGAHRCLGAALARRVGAAALGAVLDRAPNLRPAEPLDRIGWFASETALAPTRLLVAAG